MEKLINKNSIFTLILLVIFTVVLTTPTSAFAAKKHFGWSYESPEVYYPSTNRSTSSNSDDEEDSDSNYNNYRTNPSPVIYSISPNSGTAGSGAKTVIINGDNFVPGSSARINGSTRNSTYVNSSRIAMQLTNSDLANSGNYPINVFNPTPGGGLSNSVNFSVIKSVATAKSSTTTKKTTTATKTNTTTNGNQVACATAGTEDTNDSNSNLTANATFGSSGFMPKNALQWFLLAVMILLIVFLVRKIYRKDQKYRLTPLKHS